MFDPEKYLRKNPPRPFLGKTPSVKYSCALVIPAYAECGFIFSCLDSLVKNPPELLKLCMGIIVINNPPLDECPADKYEDNRRLLELLLDGQRQNRFAPLDLYLIDACSPGNEIKSKEGVGRARKIGFDSAIPHIEGESSEPFFLSLDADTIVDENYLSSAWEFFGRNPDCAAVSMRFEHQNPEDPGESEAMINYELFIRYYAWALACAKSPYAYYSIGSAMAFRADSYVKAGGMIPKNGGEDFYFLQSLRKIARIGFINSCVLRPSARLSDRVPFGTGPKLREYLGGGSNLKFYDPEIFTQILIALYSNRIKHHFKSRDFSMRDFLKELPMELVEFLEMEGFPEIWPTILKNTADREKNIRRAFDTWFDALKTLRFVHFCETRNSAGFDSARAFGSIFEFIGIPADASILRQPSNLLEKLRAIDSDPSLDGYFPWEVRIK